MTSGVALAEQRLARAAHSSTDEYWAAVRALCALLKDAGR